MLVCGRQFSVLQDQLKRSANIIHLMKSVTSTKIVPVMAEIITVAATVLLSVPNVW